MSNENQVTITHCVMYHSKEEGTLSINESIYDSIAQTKIGIQKGFIQNLSIDSSHNFEKHIDKLEVKVSDDFIPMLHIGMHGDEKEGILFDDGSKISWLHLHKMLARINKASQNNLIVIITSCNGYKLGEILLLSMKNISHSPYFGIIAPYEEISHHDAVKDFSSFYELFFGEGSCNLNFNESINNSLKNGYRFHRPGYLVLRTQDKFELLIDDIAKSHLSEEGLDDTVKRRKKGIDEKLFSEELMLSNKDIIRNTKSTSINNCSDLLDDIIKNNKLDPESELIYELGLRAVSIDRTIESLHMRANAFLGGKSEGNSLHTKINQYYSIATSNFKKILLSSIEL